VDIRRPRMNATPVVDVGADGAETFLAASEAAMPQYAARLKAQAASGGGSPAKPRARRQ
jgi:hypothetical protein